MRVVIVVSNIDFIEFIFIPAVFASPLPLSTSGEGCASASLRLFFPKKFLYLIIIYHLYNYHLSLQFFSIGVLNIHIFYTFCLLNIYILHILQNKHWATGYFLGRDMMKGSKLYII